MQDAARGVVLVAGVALQAVAAGSQLTHLVVLPGLEQPLRALYLTGGILLQRGQRAAPLACCSIVGPKRLAGCVGRLCPGPGKAPYRVVAVAGVGAALAAQYFLVQVVTLDVADELVHGRICGCRVLLAVVDLVEVARAVVEVVERSLVQRLMGQLRQHGLRAVAQKVVLVLECVALVSGVVNAASQYLLKINSLQCKFIFSKFKYR